MVHFGEFLKNWSLRSNNVTRQVSFNGTKILENAKIQKFKCDILSNFQTMWNVAKWDFQALRKLKKGGFEVFSKLHVPDFCQVTNVTIRFGSPARRKPGFLGPINTRLLPLLEALHSWLPATLIDDHKFSLLA